MKQIYSGTASKTSGIMTGIPCTYLIQKTKSHIIRHTAISLISFLFFLSICSAATSIAFNSPSEVSVDEPFEVSFEQSIDNYDVKIFVHDSVDDKIARSEIISQIKNNGNWQISWNYIPADSISDIFTLKVEKPADKAHICARLRKSGSTSFQESCKPLLIASSSTKNDNLLSSQSLQQEENSYPIQENIQLNTKTQEKSSPKVNFTSSQYKLQLIILASFSIFAIIVIILFIKRKL